MKSVPFKQADVTFDTGGRGRGAQVGKQTHTHKLTTTHTADRSICTFTNVTFELRVRNKWKQLQTTSEIFLHIGGIKISATQHRFF